ncbi:MAG: citramalate synthase [Verrucomicrobia bacterium]|nr:MAG: citramalate synthase [Verrucomicrobiota bacterium]TAE86157.1 MAG: citramalate synthase [Verrucomicrobiota bacterium]TAF23504.1 MAG: citramalate synthase [Verrucomicrobiota bacterium]TAF40132.1 MAG: citramalate synthase [Verrucomicrobiota bacterium]
MSVSSEKTVQLYDTTLRDGTQGEGFQLSLLDKLRIAERLDAFGVDYIEGGWPGSNPKDVEFFQEAKKLRLSHARLAAFGSTRRADTPVEEDSQVRLLLDAETPVVTIFGKSWELHVTEVLRTSPEENRAMIRDTVAYLKKHGREVIYDAEHFFDGYKDSPEHALASLKAAADGGADCLVLCDTNGGTLPSEVVEICTAVRACIPGTPIGIHTHNDCELAVANAIAAVDAGAVQVQGTVNGYGERTGNCNLTSVIPILQLKMGREVVPDLAKLRELSYFVDDVSNNPHFARAAFVGRTAFAHKGGMHVNAVQKLARSYEHIVPESVGNSQNILVSELSGQSNILIKAEQLGIPLDKGSVEAKAVLHKVKELENEGYAFEAAGGSLELLIRRELGRYEKPFELKEFHTSFRQYRDGHDPVCEATVKLYVGDVAEYTVAEGLGVVNALDKALRQALLPFYPEIAGVSLVDYKVRIIDGHDATAAKTRVLIVSTADGENWGTVGVSENIIEASWIALVDGIDLFLQRRRSKLA